MTQDHDSLNAISPEIVLEKINTAEGHPLSYYAQSAFRAICEEIGYTEPTTIPRSVLVAVTGILILSRETTEMGILNGDIIVSLKEEALADIRAAVVAEFLR